MINEQTGNKIIITKDQDGMENSYTETTKDNHVVYAGYDNEDSACAKLTSPAGEILVEVFGHSCIDDALGELEDWMQYEGLEKCQDGSTRWVSTTLGI